MANEALEKEHLQPNGSANPLDVNIRDAISYKSSILGGQVQDQAEIQTANAIMNQMSSYTPELTFHIPKVYLHGNIIPKYKPDGYVDGLLINSRLKDTRPLRRYKDDYNPHDDVIILKKPGENENHRVKRIRVALEKLSKWYLYEQIVENIGEKIDLYLKDETILDEIKKRVLERTGHQELFGRVNVNLHAYVREHFAKNDNMHKGYMLLADLLKVASYTSQKDVVNDFFDIVTHHLLPALSIGITISSEFNHISSAFYNTLEVSEADDIEIDLFNDLSKSIVNGFRIELARELKAKYSARPNCYKDFIELQEALLSYANHERRAVLSFDGVIGGAYADQALYIRKHYLVAYSCDIVSGRVFRYLGNDEDPVKEIEDENEPIVKVFRELMYKNDVRNTDAILKHFSTLTQYGKPVIASGYEELKHTQGHGDYSLIYVVFLDDRSHHERKITRVDYSSPITDLHAFMKSDDPKHRGVSFKETYLFPHLVQLGRILDRAKAIHGSTNRVILELKDKYERLRHFGFPVMPIDSIAFKNIQDPIEFMEKLDSVTGDGWSELAGEGVNSVFTYLKSLTKFQMKLENHFPDARDEIAMEDFKIKCLLRNTERIQTAKFYIGSEIVRIDYDEFMKHDLFNLVFEVKDKLFELKNKNGVQDPLESRLEYEQYEKKAKILKDMMETLLKEHDLRKAIEIYSQDLHTEKFVNAYKDLEKCYFAAKKIFFASNLYELDLSKSDIARYVKDLTMDIKESLIMIISAVKNIEKDYEIKVLRGREEKNDGEKM